MDGIRNLIGDALAGLLLAAVPGEAGGGPVGLLLALVFAAAMLAVFGIGALLRPAGPPRRRMPADGDAPATVLRRDNKALQRLLAPLEGSVAGGGAADRAALKVTLMRAGFFAPVAAAVFQAVRAVLALLGGGVAALAVPGLMPEATGAMRGFVILSGVAVGFYLPALALRARVHERQRIIREAFPDTLDLLLVCVEAGLGLDAALARVGQEMAGVHPVLARHFALIGLELRAGRAREDALRGMGERVGIDEVTSFVNLLIQSDRLGTSIGDALRIGADDMRTRRMLRAEEKAHQLPVKLSIPLVLFLLPGLMTVVMLPPAIQFIRVLSPAMTGQ